MGICTFFANHVGEDVSPLLKSFSRKFETWISKMMLGISFQTWLFFGVSMLDIRILRHAKKISPLFLQVIHFLRFRTEYLPYPSATPFMVCMVSISGSMGSVYVPIHGWLICLGSMLVNILVAWIRWLWVDLYMSKEKWWNLWVSNWKNTQILCRYAWVVCGGGNVAFQWHVLTSLKKKSFDTASTNDCGTKRSPITNKKQTNKNEIMSSIISGT